MDASGDVDLVFHTNLTNAANLVTQNDSAGLVVDSITFDAVAGTGATGGTSTAGYTINGNAFTINTGSVGQDPFGIDIASNVTTGTGITETFNVGVTLLNTNATFRSQQSLARLTLTGAINLGSRTLTIDNTTGGGNNANLQGVIISGDISNGALTKTGSGTLELSGNNSYAGATTVSGGFVVVETNTALGAAAGSVTVNNPAQIQLRNGVTVVKATLNNNSNALGGGLGADGNTTNTFQGNVVLNGAANTALGAGNGTNTLNRLVINGVISGGAVGLTLSINGCGTLEFVNNNTYIGQINLNGNQGPGTLQIDSPAGLGAGGAGNETIVSTGNTLLFNFNGTLQSATNVPENLQIAGTAVRHQFECDLHAVRLNHVERPDDDRRRE